MPALTEAEQKQLASARRVVSRLTNKAAGITAKKKKAAPTEAATAKPATKKKEGKK